MDRQTEDYCPYCNEMISEKECNCGMYQVLNGKCIIGECVTIVHSNLKEYKNGRKPKTA